MKLILTILVLCIHLTIQAQIPKAPDRKEGDGPYSQLILR